MAPASPAGRTSTPSTPGRTISRGPVSQSTDTGIRPLAIDSSNVLDNPSKREVSTYRAAQAYQSPTLPARPGSATRCARPASSTRRCSAAHSSPSPRITRSQSGYRGAMRA
ncbi:Uncharacterised protein [Bordetella pertussis]|nr:Uncharacterised protein [Bordetella pertussis]